MINPDFAAFAEHYVCAVVPARVRHPKDKALVGNAVKLMYRSIYVDLERIVFQDLESLNEAILKSLGKFNDRNLTRRKEARRQLFETLEKEALRTLPAIRHQMRQRVVATVQRNSYVTLDEHHYSVPVQYVGKRVEPVYDADTIDIFHGFEHVTTHHRDDRPYEYTTKASHNLPGRKGSYEDDIDGLLGRAAQIDNIVVHCPHAVIEDKHYPELAFRGCRGILKLEKKYEQHRLVSGCAAAMDAHRFTVSELVEILETGADAGYLPGSDMKVETQMTPPTTTYEANTITHQSPINHHPIIRIKMRTTDRTSPIMPEKDRNAVSMDLLHRMRLHGMAAAFTESLQARDNDPRHLPQPAAVTQVGLLSEHQNYMELKLKSLTKPLSEILIDSPILSDSSCLNLRRTNWSQIVTGSMVLSIPVLIHSPLLSKELRCCQRC